MILPIYFIRKVARLVAWLGFSFVSCLYSTWLFYSVYPKVHAVNSLTVCIGATLTMISISISIFHYFPMIAESLFRSYVQHIKFRRAVILKGLLTVMLQYVFNVIMVISLGDSEVSSIFFSFGTCYILCPLGLYGIEILQIYRSGKAKELAIMTSLETVTIDCHCSNDNSRYCEACPCPICYESFGNRSVAKTVCNHHYHTACISSWIKDRREDCPMCRHQLVPQASC